MSKIWRTINILMLLIWVMVSALPSESFQNSDMEVTVTLRYTINNDLNNNSVPDVEWSLDGHYLALTHRQEYVSIWDTENNVLIMEFSCASFRSQTLAWSPNENVLAVGCLNLQESVEIEEINNELTAIRVETDYEPISWSPDGSQLALPAADGTINVVSSTTFEVLFTLGEAFAPSPNTSDTGSGKIVRFEWSRNGQYLGVVAQGQATAVHIWDLMSRQLLHIFPFNYSDIAWLQGGVIFAILGSESNHRAVQIWDIASLKMIQELELEASMIESSPNGNYLTLCSNQELHIVDANTLQEILITNATTPEEAVACAGEDIAWSSDNKLALGQADGTVAIWQLEDIPAENDTE